MRGLSKAHCVVALWAVLPVIPLILSGCVLGDPVSSRPHGIGRDEEGRLIALSCDSDGGIVAVEAVARGTEHSQWDKPLLSLHLIDGRKAEPEVSLTAESRSYRLVRKDPLREITVTVFDSREGNLLLTTWSTDLESLKPGFVATRSGSVSRARWDQGC